MNDDYKRLCRCLLKAPAGCHVDFNFHGEHLCYDRYIVNDRDLFMYRLTHRVKLCDLGLKTCHVTVQDSGFKRTCIYYLTREQYNNFKERLLYGNQTSVR